MLRLKNTESFLFSLWVLYLCYLFLFLFSYVLVMKFRKVECELWNLSCVSACLSWLISFSLQERALISFDVPYAIPFKKYQVCPYSPTLTRGHSHGPNVRVCTISKEDVDTPNMHTDRVSKTCKLPTPKQLQLPSWLFFQPPIKNILQGSNLSKWT